MLYKGNKDVNDTARPPEGGPAEDSGLPASSLPLLDNPRWSQNQQQINAVGLDARGKGPRLKADEHIVSIIIRYTYYNIYITHIISFTFYWINLCNLDNYMLSLLSVYIICIIYLLVCIIYKMKIKIHNFFYSNVIFYVNIIARNC